MILVGCNRGSCVCSLGLVVLSEEIDGFDVLTLSSESDFGVLVDPVSKIEVEVGISGVEGVVLVPWVAIRSKGLGGLCDVTWEGEVSGSEEVVKQGDLGVEVVGVEVDLDITKVEVVASGDHTGHFLALRDGDGVGPWGRGDDGVVSEGNGADHDTEFEETVELGVEFEINCGVDACLSGSSDGVGVLINFVSVVGAISEVSSVFHLSETLGFIIEEDIGVWLGHDWGLGVDNGSDKANGWEEDLSHLKKLTYLIIIILFSGFYI